MKKFQLAAQPRTDLGKKATKALRAENKIPAVLNGGKIVELPYAEALKPGEKLVEIGNGKGLITTDLVVSLEAVRKLVYPVKDTLLHIDLLEVNENKPVVMEVPVKLEGHAEGVKAGGKLSLVMKKLRVKALYTAIPERLVLNVDHLGLGKTMQVGEIHIDGLELVNAKNAVVCAVQLTRAARGAAAAAAAGK